MLEAMAAGAAAVVAMLATVQAWAATGAAKVGAIAVHRSRSHVVGARLPSAWV